MEPNVSRETPPVVRRLYPDAVDGLSAYADLLATDGVVRGLIGPREVPRLWERHLLNCAVVEQVIPEASSVADIGSGAGLPGLVLAVVRPDLSVTLIEPLLRRTAFLEEATAKLALPNVEVLRGRAEEIDRTFDVVVSRAVAPLPKLAGWCLPLCRPGGLMVALKGSSAEDELTDAASTLDGLGAAERTIRRVAVDGVDQATTVVTIVAGRVRMTGRRTGNGR